MSFFSGNRQPAESHGDFAWRQDMEEAADALVDAANARNRGDYKRADDRATAANDYLDNASRSRRSNG